MSGSKGTGRTGPMRALLTRPVAFHPALARVCGSVTAGLMLSQALYWSERTSDGSGWFYKTQEEWTEEICLSRTEQETARKALKALGFLREEKRGMPGKMHYFVDVERVCDAISQSAENPQTSLQETRRQVCRKPTNREISTHECGKPADMSAENQQTFLSETKITAETTHQHACGAALKHWLAAKAELQQQLPASEWSLWVRPAYLLTVMSGGVLLVALPPNGRIVEAARARLPSLRVIVRAAGYSDVQLTRYPDDYERERVRQEYPAFYEQMLGNRKHEQATA